MNATSRINEDQADGAYGLTARYTRVLGLWVRLGGVFVETLRYTRTP